MSRYTKTIDDIEYAWGYDRPTSAYFYQKFDLTAEDDEDELILGIDSYFSEKPEQEGKLAYTNGEILGIMEKDGVVPEEHLLAIAGDLPF